MKRTDFSTGDSIRFKPGTGTFGYEHALQGDGRVPGVVVGLTATRVKVRLTMGDFGTRTTRVDAASLTREAAK